MASRVRSSRWTGAVLGATRNYQYWFRTPGGPCGNMANTTNGYSITWGAGGPYDEMVLIPAGTFDMGRHVGTGDSDELPVHTVYLDAFYMDVYEVSNQKYADYLNTAYAQGRVTVSSAVWSTRWAALVRRCATRRRVRATAASPGTARPSA